jgi:hypothetical protein
MLDDYTWQNAAHEKAPANWPRESLFNLPDNRFGLA